MSSHLTYTEEAFSGLYRSEDMVLLGFRMQREAAQHSILKLGQLGMVQFQDLNKNTSAFQRDFSVQVRRCDELERKMRYLDDEVKKSGIFTVRPDSDDVELASFDSLERSVEQKEHDIRELTGQFESLVLQLNRTREHMEVLERDLHGGMDALPSSAGNVAGGLNILCGCMPLSQTEIFQRLVFRTTRGNAIVRIDEIPEPFENPMQGEEVQKGVFVVFFSATRLRDKLKRLAELSGGTIYNYVESREELLSVRQKLRANYETVGTALAQNAQVRRAALSHVAHQLPEWRRQVVTEKSVFGVMNMMEFAGPTVHGKGWCPLAELDNVKWVLHEAERECGAQVATIVEVLDTKETRPTYFATNKITGTFQGIVDAYGIARYKEANPGVWTVVTFPYLFGVMYGDIGHGLMLTVFAALLIMFERQMESKPLNEIVGMIFGGRYLLFGMGVMATYVGLLYNDMFGLSTEIFNTGYTWNPLPTTNPTTGHLEGNIGMQQPTNLRLPNIKPAVSTRFGIDAAWAETENKLEFYNSVKMKCAVIIGIAQMTLGIIISLTNHLYFKDMKAVYFRFIPEITFLMCTFGYMALMIIAKWCITWDNTNLAPSLLEAMTNFFLAPGVIAVPLYNGQAGVQSLLLLIAFAMVPVLLCVIPYLEKKEHEEHVRRTASHAEEEDEDYHFDFSEIMIHQIIHTIEFVLGCVSNTASYLRLWALSLAHSQLSEVFWNFAFMMTVGLDSGSGVMVFFGFAVWLSATIGVLLMMESLGAFLHSLRLHWVEFQNKFYYGDGVPFKPFDVAAIIAESHA